MTIDLAELGKSSSKRTGTYSPEAGQYEQAYESIRTVALTAVNTSRLFAGTCLVPKLTVIKCGWLESNNVLERCAGMVGPVRFGLSIGFPYRLRVQLQLPFPFAAIASVVQRKAPFAARQRGLPGRAHARHRLAIFAFVAAIWSPVVTAQSLPDEPVTFRLISRQAVPATPAVTSDPEQTNSLAPEKTQDHRHVRYNTGNIIVAHTLAIGLYGKTKWWNEGFSGQFRTVNEGWFGRNTYAGGADKLGHFFVNYASTRLLASAFEWAGNPSEDSLVLAAWTTAGTYFAVEALDGLSKQWRFSKEDAIVNLMGVGMALILERNPGLDRLLDLRVHYLPSEENHKFEPFGDYAGQTYLIAVKASGVPALRNHPLLRYVELAIGYNARGFSQSSLDRRRSLYAGISLNLSELLGDTAFKHSSERSAAQRATDTFLEFVQVPGTALPLAKHRF